MKRCPHCLKVLFQKDKRSGKVIYLEPRWQVPPHLRAEVLGSGRGSFPENRHRASRRSIWTARARRHHHLPRADVSRRARRRGPHGRGLPGVPGLEEVQGPAAAREECSQCLEQAPLSTEARCKQRPAPRRLFTSSLRRWESLWAHLVLCLGPEAQDGVGNLKKKPLTELSRPNKKLLAYYADLFQLSSDEVREIARLHVPKPKPRPDDRLHVSAVFQIELGDRLLTSAARDSLRSHLLHDRPGLVNIFVSEQYLAQGS